MKNFFYSGRIIDLPEKSRYPKVLMEQTGIQKIGIRLIRHGLGFRSHIVGGTVVDVHQSAMGLWDEKSGRLRWEEL